jgi:flagellar protein FliT
MNVLRSPKQVKSPQVILMAYNEILEMTRVMVRHAQASDWESLIDKESEYLDAVVAMGEQENTAQLDEIQTERKAELIRESLENSKIIQDLIQDRKDELEKLIGNEETRKNLNAAYGAAEWQEPHKEMSGA